MGVIYFMGHYVVENACCVAALLPLKACFLVKLIL